MLKTQVQELEANKVALTVEVEKEAVNKAYDSYLTRAARSVRIEGFRPGKVPKAVVMKKFGSEYVREEVQRELLDEIYPKAIQEAKLEPVSNPVLEDSNLKEGESFTFKVVFEVRPKLGDFRYKGFSAQVQREIIDEESVNKVLNQLREQQTKTEVVEEGELTVGDYFSAKIDVYFEGEKKDDLSDEKAAHKYTENDPFFKHCAGMKIGETRNFSLVADSEKDKGSQYYGKTLDYAVTLNRLSRPTLPELNDEFAKKVGEFNTLEELKAKISEDLTERSKYEAEEHAFDEILTQVMNEYNFDVPEGMIQNTINFFIEGLDRRWRQFGTTIKDYLRNSGKDVNEFRESFREKAVKQTKTMLLVDAIGEKENIDVTDADYREEIEKRAKEYKMPVDKLLTTLSESDGEANVRFSLRSQKIRDFMLTNNQVNYDMVKEAELHKGETEA
ncbi:MAG: trigger factor [Candidatus Riflebacteria bacterium]|nr:trigger factor [Candidatus Riflebacteria bacterium]